MRKTGPTLVLLVLLSLGLSLAVPAEDLTETAYDESEALPGAITLRITGLMPPATASTSQTARTDRRRRLASPYRLTVAWVNGTRAHHSTDARVALALRCTLLC